MAEVRVRDPDVHDTKTVDDRGRVYVGNDLKGEEVRVVVERVEDE